MRKNLWLLDIALLGLVAFAGVTLRDRWMQADAREQRLLRQMIPVAPPPFIPALAPVTPATAGSYLEVAQQLAFSKDRNPNVILDPPPPPPAPKPMPALPLSYGVIDIGAGPTIILTDRPGAEHHGYRTGDKIGEFKIVALTQQDVTFEWEGKQVKKAIGELIDKKALEAAPPEKAQPAAQPAQQVNTLTTPGKPSLGVQLGERSRACVPNDPSPAGTVLDGFKKVINKTPFGDSCRWEAVE